MQPSSGSTDLTLSGTATTKICFICPFWGHLPNYFQLFLRSCEKNPSITWFIFTDCQKPLGAPPNVRFVHFRFEELGSLVERRVGVSPSLVTSYHIRGTTVRNFWKVCDLKPLYGILFREYVASFAFWGYCDCDMAFGNIRHELREEAFRQYDVITCQSNGFVGHCTLYRNDPLVMQGIMEIPWYFPMLRSSTCFCLDEHVLTAYTRQGKFGVFVYILKFFLSWKILWPILNTAGVPFRAYEYCWGWFHQTASGTDGILLTPIMSIARSISQCKRLRLRVLHKTRFVCDSNLSDESFVQINQGMVRSFKGSGSAYGITLPKMLLFFVHVCILQLAWRPLFSRCCRSPQISPSYSTLDSMYAHFLFWKNSWQYFGLDSYDSSALSAIVTKSGIYSTMLPLQ